MKATEIRMPIYYHSLTFQFRGHMAISVNMALVIAQLLVIAELY